jgi:MoxR-like ATPase
VRRYIAELAQATRTRKEVLLGASARAAVWLSRSAQALAFLEGRRFLVPEDVKRVAHAVLEHRLLLEPRARLSGLTPKTVVDDALEATPVPLSPALSPPPGP